MTLLDTNAAMRKIASLPTGPIAIILNEDDVDLAPTISHHKRLGFAGIVQIGRSDEETAADLIVDAAPGTHLSDAVNPLLPAMENRWVYAGHNAEFLYFPFCETRTISDVTQFVQEERRQAVFCTTVDLYSDDLTLVDKGVCTGEAFFDKMGYFALDRFDGPDRLERQIDLFGGLKWRYSEHIPWERQRIDRIGLFRADPGVALGADYLLNSPELNTVNCAWHNSLTCAVASLRVAKSLLRNPGSAFEIGKFTWSQSERFAWNSQQLLDLGLMEPGQWF